MNLKNYKKSKKGFSIIEVILAGSILALVVFGVISAWLYGEHSLIKSGDRGRGIAIASEGIEITRNLRDFDFNSLNDGTYALENYGTGWTLRENQFETIGNFKRTITIVSDGISKKNITSTADWTNIDGTPATFSVTTVLTNWRQIKTPPKKTSALTITNVNASPWLEGATITWTTNKQASSYVQYGTSTSYGSEITETDTSPRVTEHSIPITGLLPDTVYHYKVTSVTASGEQASSLDGTFRTDADTTPPVISNILVTQNSSTSVTISWDTEDELGADEASSSYVQYGIGDISENNTPEINTSPRVVHHSVALSDLTPLETYYYKLFSNDASQNLGTSSTLTFTLVTVNELVISNVTSVAVGSTYITWSWATNLPSDASLVDDDRTGTSPVVNTDPNSTSHTNVTISGLIPCTIYGIQAISTSSVSGEDLAGLDPGSDSTTVRTRGCDPEVVSSGQYNIGNIDRIVVRPQSADVEEVNDYVYALNKQGNTVSVFEINSRHSSYPSEYNIYEQNSIDLSQNGITTPLAISVDRNFMYILDDNGEVIVKIYEIDQEHPEQLTYRSDLRYSGKGKIQNFFLREINDNGVPVNTLFVAYDDELIVFDTKNSYNTESWEILYQDSFPGPFLATDMYVTKYVDSPEKQYLYLTGIDTDVSLDVTGNEYLEGFLSRNVDNSFGRPQISAMEEFNPMMFTGMDGGLKWEFKENNLAEAYVTEVISRAVAISKNIEPLDTIFGNTNRNDSEYKMARYREEFIDVQTLDIEGEFDEEMYNEDAPATIEYLINSGLVFFTKSSKLLLIDPGL